MKTCYKCKKTKSESEFCKDKSTKCGLNNKCKACTKIYNEIKVNKDRKSALGKAYREVNREQLAIKQNLYHFANQERRRQLRRSNYVINKEKVKVVSKAWEQANRERRLAISHKRRALKLSSEGSYTEFDIKGLLLVQDSRCVYCETNLIIDFKKNCHVDHRMPLFLGGSNHPENLQLLCPSCNLSKGRKHPDVYEKEINYNRNKE
jgi:5-methylcytosine-specific restriction endonuclease McrA